MRERIRKVVGHPLIAGSLLLFGGGLFANFFNFLFNILMIRFLPVADYGVLAIFISLILIFSYASDSLVPTIVHFASIHFVKKEYSEVRYLFLQFNKIVYILGAFFFLAIAACSPIIASFLHIRDVWMVVLLGFIVFLCFVLVVNRSFLQAELKFKYISISGIASSIVKLLAGVGLVLAGWRIAGALFAFVATYTFSNIITFLPLRRFVFFYKSSKPAAISFNSLFTYGLPSALAIIFLACYITTDVILVKHFFDPQQAGLYAGLSLLGKIIFFFSAPIATVMFPLITRKHAKGESYKNVFWLSLFIVLFLSLAITAFYFVFPEFTIRFFLKKDEYLTLIPYVGIFGIFGTGYALLTVLTNFYLAIKKTYVFIPILVGAVLQAVLISLFHSNFLQIILISLGVTMTLFITLLGYYWKKYASKY
jgi:O-antigen/teichoic acid export membrane protein